MILRRRGGKMPRALLASLTALALLTQCSALLPAPAAIASGIASSTGWTLNPEP